MNYYDESGKRIDHTRMEASEQYQATQYVNQNATVLELGARYGTVTCAISKNLNNKNNLVSVEPDARVWAALENNLKINNCTAHIVKGFISNKSMSLANLDSWYGYGTTSVASDSSSIPYFTLDQIQKKYGLTFDTLVADCEGFLEQFFDENPLFAKQLKLILFEKDYPDKCNYSKIEAMLKAEGFNCIVSGFHSVWRK